MLPGFRDLFVFVQKYLKGQSCQGGKQSGANKDNFLRTSCKAKSTRDNNKIFFHDQKVPKSHQ